MSSDDNIAGSRFKPLKSPFMNLSALKTRNGFNSNRRSVKARSERLEMLFRQNSRRRKNGSLFSVERGDVGCTHRDFGLAVAGIPADQPVHRLRRGKILFNRLNRRELIARLFVRERRIERLTPITINIVRKTRGRFTLRLSPQKRRGQIGDGLLGVELIFIPAFPVQPVQSYFLSLDADIS